LREHEGLAREKIRPGATSPYRIGATSDTPRERIGALRFGDRDVVDYHRITAYWNGE